MGYERPRDFVENRMRMSHVYQPVMLLALLRRGGEAGEITWAILAHDEIQVEYYEDITKNMVGRVLRRYGLVEKRRDRLSSRWYTTDDEKSVDCSL